MHLITRRNLVFKVIISQVYSLSFKLSFRYFDYFFVDFKEHMKSLEMGIQFNCNLEPLNSSLSYPFLKDEFWTWLKFSYICKYILDIHKRLTVYLLYPFLYFNLNLSILPSLLCKFMYLIFVSCLCSWTASPVVGRLQHDIKSSPLPAFIVLQQPHCEQSILLYSLTLDLAIWFTLAKGMWSEVTVYQSETRKLGFQRCEDLFCESFQLL